jgi:metal-responsive CopG/Arc/MetJ family transcriptional regulator
MSTAKIAISIEETLLQKLDRLVKAKEFPNRSKAVQGAIEEKLARMNHSRLARECAKLNPQFEKSLAEEGFSAELEKWPEF